MVRMVARARARLAKIRQTLTAFGLRMVRMVKA